MDQVDVSRMNMFMTAIDDKLKSSNGKVLESMASKECTYILCEQNKRKIRLIATNKGVIGTCSTLVQAANMIHGPIFQTQEWMNKMCKVNYERHEVASKTTN